MGFRGCFFIYRERGRVFFFAFWRGISFFRLGLERGRVRFKLSLYYSIVII